MDKTLDSARAGSVRRIDVPPRPYLKVDGSGDPSTSHLPMACARRSRPPSPPRVPVMPLEGLWWVRAGASFSYADKTNWEWSLLIRQPDSVDDTLLPDVKYAALRRNRLPATQEVRLEIFLEGLALQIQSVGSFSTEPATAVQLDACGRDPGYTMSGKHHEIYLSDFQRAARGNLRTIIRHPVRPEKSG